MVELTRTNDPVLISWLTAALDEAGVEALVLDAHTSVMEGSVGAIPRRIMVDGAHIGPARLVLAEADRLAGGGPLG